MAPGGSGSDARFAAVAESVNDAIIGADSSGTIRYANGAAARLFGRPVDELVGAPLASLMPEHLRKRHLHGFAAFMTTGESHLVGRGTIELVALTATGDEVPVELSLGAWAAEDGERRVAGVLRDISSRKAAERARRAQEAVSRVLSETDDVDRAMQALLRDVGKVMGWRVGLFWARSGPGLELHSSWHEGESGRAFLERSSAMVFARGIGLPGRAWHEGRPIWVEDFRDIATFPRAPAASADDLRAAIALPVIDSAHEVIGVLEFLGQGAERPPPDAMTTMGLLGDRIGQFIRRKAAEAELARSNAELTRFADAAAHDLSEPLRTMRGLGELLERRHGSQLDDGGRELLAGLLSAGARGEALVQAILAYARVGGEQEIADEPVDSAALAAEVVRSLARTITEAGATVGVGDLPVVRGDADLLGQLFQNLISNALRFRGDAAPRIELTATPEATRWRFRVADNGIGISPGDRERVFELFTRLEPAAHPGTGTGLAVSRRIVERHGGQIHVEANEPAGSVFEFTLSAEPRS
jgi:PAS domain S-box-containing protein